MALTPSIKDCHSTFDCSPFCVCEVDLFRYVFLLFLLCSLVHDVHAFKVHRQDVFLVACFGVGLGGFVQVLIPLMSPQRKQLKPNRNHSEEMIQRASSQEGASCSDCMGAPVRQHSPLPPGVVAANTACHKARDGGSLRSNGTQRMEFEKRGKVGRRSRYWWRDVESLFHAIQ